MKKINDDNMEEYKVIGKLYISKEQFEMGLD